MRARPFVRARLLVLSLAIAAFAAAIAGAATITVNSTGVDVINAQYGPNWRRPVVLQTPRYVKISGQFDF